MLKERLTNLIGICKDNAVFGYFGYIISLITLQPWQIQLLLTVFPILLSSLFKTINIYVENGQLRKNRELEHKHKVELIKLKLGELVSGE